MKTKSLFSFFFSAFLIFFGRFLFQFFIVLLILSFFGLRAFFFNLLDLFIFFWFFGLLVCLFRFRWHTHNIFFKYIILVILYILKLLLIDKVILYRFTVIDFMTRKYIKTNSKITFSSIISTSCVKWANRPQASLPSVA